MPEKQANNLLALLSAVILAAEQQDMIEPGLTYLISPDESIVQRCHRVRGDGFCEKLTMNQFQVILHNHE